MKVLKSLRSAKNRHRDCKIVSRKGRLLVKGNWKVITSSVFDVVVVAFEPRAHGSVVAANKTEETIEARIIGVHAAFFETVAKSPLANIASGVAYLFEHIGNGGLGFWQVSPFVKTSSVDPNG